MLHGPVYLRTRGAYVMAVGVAVLLLAGMWPVGAATIVVYPWDSIQAAIDGTNDGDTVVIAPGVYHQRINFDGHNISVQSSDPTDPNVVAGTVLNGDAAGSVVTFNHGETAAAVLSGLTITNGRAERGGGIYCNSGSPTITGNVIRANAASGSMSCGGGLYLSTSGGTSMISGNTVTANVAGDAFNVTIGGGMYISVKSGGTVAVTGNVIMDNRATGSPGGGGGMYCDLENGCVAVVSGNTFASNWATAFAAGMHVFSHGTATICGNLISGNGVTDVLGRGAGICCSAAEGTMTVAGNVVSDNIAPGRGALCCEADATATLIARGNTVSGNRGGGIEAAGEAASTIINCIVTGSSCGEGISLASGTPAPNVTYCNVHGNAGGEYGAGVTAGTGCLSADPLFVNAAQGDFHVRSRAGHWTPGGWVIDAVTSPCLDAGDPSSPYDQETGYNGNRVNMGAYGNTPEASRTDPNQSPSAPTSLTIAPIDPTTTDDLVATGEGGADPEGGSVSYICQWCCSTDEGGTWSAWGHRGETLPASQTRKGEWWKARARASDEPLAAAAARAGTSPLRARNMSAWVESNPVTIGDTGPTTPAQVVIIPAEPKTADDLTAAASGATDPDGDTVDYEYQWASSDNGGTDWSVWGHDGPTLDHGQTAKGQLWKAQARAVAGGANSGWTESAAVRIGNTDPEQPATVAVTPERPGAGQDLTAQAAGATDLDAADDPRYEYQWCRRPAGGAWGDWGHDGATLAASQTARGQQWKARARALAGAGPRHSAWAESQPVVIGAGAPVTVTASGQQTPSGLAQIAVTLSTAATVRVQVMNLAGRVVARLPEQALESGTQTLSWNGRSTAGTPVPPGQYLVQVEALAAGGGCSRALAPLRK